ncbi:MAG TPA: transposase [Polyangiaceae bacterium]|nr:transposase [Polyangiaceae bacterium]
MAFTGKRRAKLIALARDSAERVLKLLGISNQRLVGMDERGVTFRTKDGKTITIPGVELLTRFVQHVLRPRFVKIRHYGLHAPSNATTRLRIARRRLAPSPAAPTLPEPVAAQRTPDFREPLLRLASIDISLCPVCHQPSLIRLACRLRAVARRRRPHDQRAHRATNASAGQRTTPLQEPRDASHP